ncbi:hypothetical protein OG21DRAFT_1002988 [Imleria badia]|nr:hypothetical protein OG21DRAFT_1002988 [Imleria badia]
MMVGRRAVSLSGLILLGFVYLKYIHSSPGGNGCDLHNRPEINPVGIGRGPFRPEPQHSLLHHTAFVLAQCGRM